MSAPLADARQRALAATVVGHQLCHGAAQTGSWHAYCSCSRWALTTDSGANLGAGFTSHVTAELAALVTPWLHEERTAGRAEAGDAVEAVLATMTRPPCWGPNDHGELMVDMGVDAYEADLNRIRAAITGPQQQQASTRRPSRRGRSGRAAASGTSD